MSARPLPLFLRLAGRDVLVVGAGPIAARKIDELTSAGAEVRVVAPAAVSRVRALAEGGTIAWEVRPFEDADADGAWLVVAATGDPEVQRRVSAGGEARRTFVVAIDDLENGSAWSAAVVRRGPLTVAISSSAHAPALTRLVRELIEQLLPEESWADAARALRDEWRAAKTPMASRFGELVRSFAAAKAADESDCAQRKP